jgi:hypothetical protein
VPCRTLLHQRAQTPPRHARAIGRIHRFIAMYAREYFRRIGLAIAKRAVISANDRTVAGPARRITPIGARLGANPLGSKPPYRPERASAPEQGEKRQYDWSNSQHNHRNLKPHIIPHQVEIALGCS